MCRWPYLPLTPEDCCYTPPIIFPAFMVTVSGIYTRLRLCFLAATEKYGPRLYFLQTDFGPRCLEYFWNFLLQIKQYICNPTHVGIWSVYFMCLVWGKKRCSLSALSLGVGIHLHGRAFMFYICSLGIISLYIQDNDYVFFQLCPGKTSAAEGAQFTKITCMLLKIHRRSNTTPKCFCGTSGCSYCGSLKV